MFSEDKVIKNHLMVDCFSKEFTLLCATVWNSLEQVDLSLNLDFIECAFENP